MKKTIHMLQTQYMYVLGRSFNINCTSFQYIAWKVFEMFIDKETAQKIGFHKESNPKELVANFHPSQLERRFGGEAETPT